MLSKNTLLYIWGIGKTRFAEPTPTVPPTVSDNVHDEPEKDQAGDFGLHAVTFLHELNSTERATERDIFLPTSTIKSTIRYYMTSELW